MIIKENFAPLRLINKIVFEPLHLEMERLIELPESKAYAAHSFELNKEAVQFRIAKITPTKIGQFVAIWTRNSKGITEPFHHSNAPAFFMITTLTENNLGLFIFPKDILVQRALITHENTEGKRGIRVYPKWDMVTSKQALKTKAWQSDYFVDLTDLEQVDNTKILKILS